jgi:hypothetical protein
MDTYTASHCPSGSLARFIPTGEFGTVLGTLTDELNVGWISFEWSDASRTELPCTDCEDIQIEAFEAEETQQ